jgi:2-phospho-L-lactate guanylyltransferase
MAQALVPLKDLVQAKTRLAGLLRPSERRALAQAMVEDVLAVVARHPALSRVTLLSDDPCAALLADKYAIRWWPESALEDQLLSGPGPARRDLNTLLAGASERLLRECVDEPLLVLHGDLPLLGSADITAVLACQRDSGALVIGCDRHGTGTNLLAFDGGSVPQFCFGPDSCQRHRNAAGSAAIRAAVLRRPGIAFDVDEPDDIAALMTIFAGSGKAVSGRGPAVHSAGLLCGSALGARIQLALGSPGGQPAKPDGQIHDPMATHIREQEQTEQVT